MAAINIGSFKLPSLPADWSAEKDFKPVGKLSQATQRNIEPVGAHFLAEARRVCRSYLMCGNTFIDDVRNRKGTSAPSPRMSVFAPRRA